MTPVTDAGMCAVDTSVAVPLLLGSHEAHESVSAWAAGRSLALAGHALAETYAVLTRLPGDARVDPQDAVALIDDSFPDRVTLPEPVSGLVHRTFADLRISGGAVYDALVALAAQAHSVPLATRDARARGTYEALGVQVLLISPF